MEFEMRSFPGECERGHKLRYMPALYRVYCPLCDADFILEEMKAYEAEQKQKAEAL